MKILFISDIHGIKTNLPKVKEKFEELYQTVLEADREKMRQMMRTSTERRARFDRKK